MRTFIMPADDSWVCVDTIAEARAILNERFAAYSVAVYECDETGKVLPTADCTVLER